MAFVTVYLSITNSASIIKTTHPYLFYRDGSHFIFCAIGSIFCLTDKRAAMRNSPRGTSAGPWEKHMPRIINTTVISTYSAFQAHRDCAKSFFNFTYCTTAQASFNSLPCAQCNIRTKRSRKQRGINMRVSQGALFSIWRFSLGLMLVLSSLSDTHPQDVVVCITPYFNWSLL